MSDVAGWMKRQQQIQHGLASPELLFLRTSADSCAELVGVFDERVLTRPLDEEQLINLIKHAAGLLAAWKAKNR